MSRQLQFENYLGKLAVDTLKMTADEYKHLREKQTQDEVMDELQRRSLEKGVASYNLRALRQALFINQRVSTRTHYEWQPSEVGGIFVHLKHCNTFTSNTGVVLKQFMGPSVVLILYESKSANYVAQQIFDLFPLFSRFVIVVL